MKSDYKITRDKFMDDKQRLNILRVLTRRLRNINKEYDMVYLV